VRVIARYLYGNDGAIYTKWDTELQDGCLVVTNVHKMPHWSPVEVMSDEIDFPYLPDLRLPAARGVTRGQAGMRLHEPPVGKKERT
jgi:hypothetical protein